MNTTKQPNKFARFIKNNAALLLIIFCVLAIGTTVLVVGLTKNNAIEDNPVVVDPDDKNDDPVTPDPTDDPVTPEKQTVKVYFVSPVDYSSVTMEYTDGSDVLFVFNKTLNMWKTHSALDLAAEEGAEVRAMYDGTVIEVSESFGMGNIVKIDHGENVVATYASLGNVEVVKGQAVKAGEKIGDVSTTASYEFSDGAHLHLEVAVNGTAVDPTPYVEGTIFREIEQEVASN